MDSNGTGDEATRGAVGRRRTPPSASQHLDLVTLGAYIDGMLDRDERAAVAAHLASCAACRQELTEISGTVDLLHELPRYRPHRTFRLDPAGARRERGNVVWLGRYLPVLPALRAATAAVALLFLGTIVADLLTGPDAASDQNFAAEQAAAPAPAGQEQGLVATATTAAAADQNQAMEAAGAAVNDEAAGAQSDSQSRATAIPAPTATATPVPPTPAPVPEAPAANVETAFPWRVAEIVFGLTLFLLLAAVLALQRLRRRLGNRA